jgi:hypothetical protein
MEIKAEWTGRRGRRRKLMEIKTQGRGRRGRRCNLMEIRQNGREDEEEDVS